LSSRIPCCAGPTGPQGSLEIGGQRNTGEELGKGVGTSWFNVDFEWIDRSGLKNKNEMGEIRSSKYQKQQKHVEKNCVRGENKIKYKKWCIDCFW